MLKSYKDVCFFVLLLCAVTTNGQSKIEELVKSFQTPNGWTAGYTTDTSYFPLFKRKQVGNWKFKYANDTSKQVSFTIFKFSAKEMDSFAEATDRYLLLSSCIYVKGENKDYNFVSFVKEDFFFLINMCPCTTQDIVCANLAYTINNWAID